MLVEQDFQASMAASLDGQAAVVIDLADLFFVDSTGIPRLRGAGAAGWLPGIVFRAPQPQVAHVLNVVGIERVPNVRPRRARRDGRAGRPEPVGGGAAS